MKSSSEASSLGAVVASYLEAFRSFVISAARLLLLGEEEGDGEGG